MKHTLLIWLTTCTEKEKAARLGAAFAYVGLIWPSALSQPTMAPGDQEHANDDNEALVQLLKTYGMVHLLSCL